MFILVVIRIVTGELFFGRMLNFRKLRLHRELRPFDYIMRLIKLQSKQNIKMDDKECIEIDFVNNVITTYTISYY